MEFPYQHTLANRVSCAGVGLHSGQHVSLTLCPAPEDTGIVFKRTDIRDADPFIVASYKHVSSTMLATTLRNASGAEVATIEHLMAALWGCDIDNAIIEVDAPEVPIMDGSSEPFVFLIECAGIEKQAKPRRVIEILKPVEVREGDKWASFKPSDNFLVNLEIDFNNKVISTQSCAFDASDLSFKTDLSRARSFGLEKEVKALKSQGLVKGGSLDNAIVVGEDKILNKDGLRYEDEFVRHKVLDCIGDFYLAGAPIKGQFDGVRTGHALNNRLLHAVFADDSAWQEVTFPVERTMPVYAEQRMAASAVM